jgi:hypothetical protein
LNPEENNDIKYPIHYFVELAKMGFPPKNVCKAVKNQDY